MRFQWSLRIKLQNTLSNAGHYNARFNSIVLVGDQNIWVYLSFCDIVALFSALMG